MTDNHDKTERNKVEDKNREKMDTAKEKEEIDDEIYNKLKEWIYELEEKGATEQIFYVITEIMEDDYASFIRTVDYIFDILKEKSVEKANEFLYEVLDYRRKILERQEVKEKINKKFHLSLKEELISSFTKKKNIISYIIGFVTTTMFIIILLSQNPITAILNALAFILPICLGLGIVLIVIRSFARSISSSYLFPKTIKQNKLMKTLQIVGLFIINFWIMTIALLQEYMIYLEEWQFVLILVSGMLLTIVAIIISSLPKKEFEAFLLDWHSFFIEYKYLSSLLEYTLIQNLSKKSQNAEYSKTIFQILKRVAELIEYKIYPDLRIQIKHEDSHRIYLAIKNNEIEIIYQFVNSIKMLNLARFEDFYVNFHKLIQIVRSDDVKNPSDAFMFKHKLKIVAKIKRFISNNIGKILTSTFVGIIVYVITRYL